MFLKAVQSSACMLVDNMVLEFLRFRAKASFVVNDSYTYHSKRLSGQHCYLIPPDCETSNPKEGTYTTGLLSRLPHHFQLEKAVEGKERRGTAFSLGLAQPNLKRLLLKLKAALEPRPLTQGSTAEAGTQVTQTRRSLQRLYELNKVATREPRLLLEPIFYEGTVQV